MTENRALKTSVRARMEATGENYTTALQAIRAERDQQLLDNDARDTEAWRRVPFTPPTIGDDRG